jgi:hypothetical protein
MYAPHVEREMPGTWVLAADADRVFESTYEGRPQRPLIRRYEPHDRTRYTEVQITRALDLPRVFADFTPHLGLMKPAFQAPAWGPHISVIRGTIEKVPKHLDVWDLAVQIGDITDDLHAATRKGDHRQVGRLRGELRELRARWTALGVPGWLTPGSGVTFEYDPDMQLGKTHWFLRTQSQVLGGIREFFGLSARPRVPFHLTVGVTEG